MTRSVFAIHVGMDRVDPSCYPRGFHWNLRGCEKDAKTMRQLVRSRCAEHFPVEPCMLLNEQATVADVKATFMDVAALAKTGDLVIFTFSGHGAWIRALPHTQTVGVPHQATGYAGPLWFHPTIVLFDRMMMDDEWRVVWSAFADGVAVVTMFDSCVSGTAPISNFFGQELDRSKFAPTPQPPASRSRRDRRTRTTGLEAIAKTYLRHRETYIRIEKTLSSVADYGVIGLHFGACLDSQVADEGPHGGYFTVAIQQALEHAPASLSYEQLYADVRKRLEREGLQQTPTLVPFGVAHRGLLSEPVFGVRRKAAVLT